MIEFIESKIAELEKIVNKSKTTLHKDFKHYGKLLAYKEIREELIKSLPKIERHLEACALETGMSHWLVPKQMKAIEYLFKKGEVK